ncbi:MAG: HAD-IIA family hydrolase, partial [Microbacterium sp.]
IESALVLTGIDRPKHVLAAAANARPTYIVGDLRELFDPYPLVRRSGNVTRVGDASVEIDGPDIRILSDGNEIDLLRAAAHGIWATGRQIFGFRVPERLYADPFHRQR